MEETHAGTAGKDYLDADRLHGTGLSFDSNWTYQTTILVPAGVTT